MDIYRSDGWTIRRDHSVITELLHALEADEAISRDIGQFAYRPQGSSHGGALHFIGRRRSRDQAVFIKVGAFAEEVRWAQAIAICKPELAPELLGAGMSLNGRALGWLATEYLRHGPLGPSWAGAEFRLAMDAAADFQAVAATLALPVRELDTVELGRVLARAADLDAPGPARALLSRLHQDWDWLCSRCPPSICHGDLHLANVLSRQPPPEGPGVLIDFQPIRQPWPLEAAYCQSLQLSQPERPGSQHLVEVLRKARERNGFRDSRVSPREQVRIERLSLGWMAMRSWQNPGVDRTNPRFSAGISVSIEQALE